MTDQFTAEIRVFPFGNGNWVPTGWAFCDGQLMPITQNTALFSLLGTVYGGDGKSTFGLPAMQGRVPVHPTRQNGRFGFLGEFGGEETVSLLESETPQHTHTVAARDEAGSKPIPTNNALARYPGAYQTSTGGLQAAAPQALSPAGASLPHNNMMPYLTMTFAIALIGIFPPRS